MSQDPRGHVAPLDVVQLRPLAEGLARRYARQRADVDDLVQVGLLAYIVDHRRLKRRAQTRSGRLPSEAKAWALARGILRRAMLGYYGTIAERRARSSESLQADLLDQHYGIDERQTELLEMHEYLDALERSCGRQARTIVENLIAPTGECAVKLMKIIQRKRRLQYAHSNPRVHMHSAVRTAVQRALDLDDRTFAEHMAQVQGFTRGWLSKTA